VITGLGVVAPNGIGKDAFWESLIAGKSAVDFISAFDPSPYPCKVAAEVRNFDPTDFMQARRAKRLAKFSQFAVAAAELAIADADLRRPALGQSRRVGVCFGTSASGIGDIGEENYRLFLASGPLRLNPRAMLEYPSHAATSHVAAALSVSGPSTTISSGCATGVDTVAWGLSEIRRGALDVAIVGAAEAPISEFILGLFSAGRFLSEWDGAPDQASRPYDLLRSGLVLGEGAACLIIEDLLHASDRNARVYAEIGGIGSSAEGGFAGGVQDVYANSLSEALRSSINDARINPSEIDHINSHGNSTKNDDAAETRAYKLVFGTRAYSLPIVSIKGALGQPLAAGGVFQLVTAALSLAAQYLPPTINQDIPDPECDLDYVPNRPRSARLRNALVHSHSLGGLLPGSHTAVVLASHPRRLE
jgi:3-oxoacyl-[acyl-carrier-protein] synthase II